MKSMESSKSASVSPVFLYRGHISLFAILSLLPPIYIRSIKHAAFRASAASKNGRASYDI